MWDTFRPLRADRRSRSELDQPDYALSWYEPEARAGGDDDGLRG